jgi:hypothetical protein
MGVRLNRGTHTRASALRAIHSRDTAFFTPIVMPSDPIAELSLVTPLSTVVEAVKYTGI